MIERFSILNSSYSTEQAIAGGAEVTAIESAGGPDIFVGQRVYASMPGHGFVPLLAVGRVASVTKIILMRRNTKHKKLLPIK